jgi:hypothetical protein
MTCIFSHAAQYFECHLISHPHFLFPVSSLFTVVRFYFLVLPPRQLILGLPVISISPWMLSRLLSLAWQLALATADHFLFETPFLWFLCFRLYLSKGDNTLFFSSLWRCLSSFLCHFILLEVAIKCLSSLRFILSFYILLDILLHSQVLCAGGEQGKGGG